MSHWMTLPLGFEGDRNKRYQMPDPDALLDAYLRVRRARTDGKSPDPGDLAMVLYLAQGYLWLTTYELGQECCVGKLRDVWRKRRSRFRGQEVSESVACEDDGSRTAHKLVETAHLEQVIAERDESRKEARDACIALADGFVPKTERAGAHLQGLPRLVAHAVEHHEWHHDAADAQYVARIESERDQLAEELARLRAFVDEVERAMKGVTRDG